MEQVLSIIRKYTSFAVCGHVNPDGDCIGSCTAFCRALEKLGKRAVLLIGPEQVPDRLMEIWDGRFCGPADGAEVFCALDCADVQRLSCGADAWEQVPVTMCIDHHKTNGGFAQANLVDAQAAATGELVFAVIQALGLSLTEEVALPLYGAICADTGNFRYSNTTPHTHEIAARLMETGIDFSGLTRRMFDTMTIGQLQAQAYAMEHLTLHCNGRVAFMPMPYQYLEEHGMTFDEVDFLSSLPRTIEGVEVRVYFKQKSGCEVKISLRSNDRVDVAALAGRFGGGGHIRAAGATICGTLENAMAQVLQALEEVL